MQLFDVNVLINAHKQDAPGHDEYRAFLERTVTGPDLFGLSELVCSAFVRIVTDRRVYVTPMAVENAVKSVRSLLGRENCQRIQPGRRHFEIFTDLCLRTPVRGKDVADAYLAALAIESGCEWVTDDRGFARFPGLRWRRPLDEV